MSDQFPATQDTPMMTVPGIIEWLSGEVEDLKAKHAAEPEQILRDMIQAQWLHVDVLIAKLTATTMSALDGNESAGRRKGERA